MLMFSRRKAPSVPDPGFFHFLSGLSASCKTASYTFIHLHLMVILIYYFNNEDEKAELVIISTISIDYNKFNNYM